MKKNQRQISEDTGWGKFIQGQESLYESNWMFMDVMLIGIIVIFIHSRMQIASENDVFWSRDIVECLV